VGQIVNLRAGCQPAPGGLTTRAENQGELCRWSAEEGPNLTNWEPWTAVSRFAQDEHQLRALPEFRERYRVPADEIGGDLSRIIHSLQPDYLRWCAMLIRQTEEVGTTPNPFSFAYSQIAESGVSPAKPTWLMCADPGNRSSNRGTILRQKIRVEQQLHCVTLSLSCAANCRGALMSSGLSSG
jgi:hypothetical protein